MKNTSNLLKVAAVLFLLPIILFSFCTGDSDNNIKQTRPDSTAVNLDTAMDKFVGLYVYLNHYYYSVGKFPGNTKMHPTDTTKYFPLEEKFIGDYFIVEDRFVWETKKTTDYAGGYIAAPRGNLMLGVESDGTIHIQNYLSFTKPDGTLDMGLGGTTTYGKFVPREDGHYDLKVNNALYIWTKK